jgi:hypothetical protein
MSWDPSATWLGLGLVSGRVWIVQVVAGSTFAELREALRSSIGKSTRLFTRAPPCGVPQRPRWRPPRAPLVTRPQPPAAACHRGLTRGDDSVSGVACAQAVGRSVGKSWGGDDCTRHCRARRGERHHYGAHLASGPMLAWASSNAKSSWRQRAGAMGGGTDASLRWRRIRGMTDSWVIAAIILREPRRHNGQVAIARSKTRPSSLAQCQYGVPGLVSSPSIPC